MRHGRLELHELLAQRAELHSARQLLRLFSELQPVDVSQRLL
jgi:hypothetical protein